MAEGEFQHLEFNTFAEVKGFYKTNSVLKPLDDNWTILRLKYPTGQYDGYYIFSAISSMVDGELKIPRVVVPVKNCTRSEQNFIEGEIYSEDQYNGPAKLITHFETHVIVDSYDEMLKYFSVVLRGISADEWDIFRVDLGESMPHPESNDAHIFLAFNWDTGMEIDVPRAILYKSKCGAADDDKIQMIEYIDDILLLNFDFEEDPIN